MWYFSNFDFNAELFKRAYIDLMKQATYRPERSIKDVIINPPATIIFWEDGTKTVSKCDDSDTYSLETGFLVCIAKKVYGNKPFRKIMEEWVWTDDEDEKGNNTPSIPPDKLFDHKELSAQ